MGVVKTLLAAEGGIELSTKSRVKGVIVQPLISALARTFDVEPRIYCNYQAFRVPPRMPFGWLSIAAKCYFT